MDGASLALDPHAASHFGLLCLLSASFVTVLSVAMYTAQCTPNTTEAPYVVPWVPPKYGRSSLQCAEHPACKCADEGSGAA